MITSHSHTCQFFFAKALYDSKIDDANSELGLDIIPRVFFFINIAPSAPPNNFSCTAIDESHIHCSWRPPPRKDRNGLIIGYMIRCKLSNKDTSVKKSVNNSVLSMTLDKLQAYTVYHIDVAAKSSKGQGPFSDRIVVTTHETSK